MPVKTQASIGPRLIELRRARGFTQQELANRTGTYRERVCQYENGIRTPSLHTFVALCNALHVSPSSLLIDNNILCLKVKASPASMLESPVAALD